VKMGLCLKISFENSLDRLHKRPGLKVSKFVLFSEKNFSSQMWTFYECAKNACRTVRIISNICCYVFVFCLWFSGLLAYQLCQEYRCVQWKITWVACVPLTQLAEKAFGGLSDLCIFILTIIILLLKTCTV
jgi:hypothetical protein